MDEFQLLDTLIQLEQVRIECEAMKAENAARERRGDAQAYGEDAFMKLCGCLESLRERIRG
jgi:hypothetical protein